MEFYEVVNKRHCIRQFTKSEIPREALERILNAACVILPYLRRMHPGSR